MNTKTNLFSFVIVFCLFFTLSMPVLAADSILIDDDNLDKMDFDLLTTGIINGDITPVNEFSGEIEFDIINDINNNGIMLTNGEQVTVTTKEPIIDIRRVNNAENDQTKESYVATLIVTNEYKYNSENDDEDGIMPLLNKGKEETFCDVTMVCSVSYDKILTNEHSDVGLYSIKIKSVTGKYLSSSDPQMRCKELTVYSRASGCCHKSATASRLPNSETSDDLVVSEPVKGTGYTNSESQNNYYCPFVTPTFNEGVLEFTVARYNSGYTGNSRITVAF